MFADKHRHTAGKDTAHGWTMPLTMPLTTPASIIIKLFHFSLLPKLVITVNLRPNFLSKASYFVFRPLVCGSCFTTFTGSIKRKQARGLTLHLGQWWTLSSVYTCERVTTFASGRTLYPIEVIHAGITTSALWSCRAAKNVHQMARITLWKDISLNKSTISVSAYKILKALIMGGQRSTNLMKFMKTCSVPVLFIWQIVLWSWSLYLLSSSIIITPLFFFTPF